NAAFYDEPSRTVFLVISQDNKLSLNTFDIQTRQLTTIENLNNFTNNPAIIYKDSKGGIWVAGQAGEVIRYRGNGQTTEHWDLSYLIPEKNDHGQQMSRCIAEDRNGRIWIASDAGLTRISFSGTQLEFRAISNHGENGPVFRSNWIFSVYPDPHNPDMLWLGTMSGGLAQFNIQSEKVWYVTDDNNPGFDVVTGIVVEIFDCCELSRLYIECIQREFIILADNKKDRPGWFIIECCVHRCPPGQTSRPYRCCNAPGKKIKRLVRGIHTCPQRVVGHQRRITQVHIGEIIPDSR
ncbi:MAG: two-component regulator propeller domain-containing protein, partial [Bacteroidota bacterium]